MKNIYKYIMCLLLMVGTWGSASAYGDPSFHDVVRNIRYDQDNKTLIFDTYLRAGYETAGVTIICSRGDMIRLSWRGGGRTTINVNQKAFGTEYIGCGADGSDIKIKIPAELLYDNLTIKARYTEDDESYYFLQELNSYLPPPTEGFVIKSCTELSHNCIEGTASYSIKWAHPDWWTPGKYFAKDQEVVTFNLYNGSRVLTEGEHYLLENIDDDGCTIVIPDLSKIGNEGNNTLTANLLYQSNGSVKKNSSFPFSCKIPVKMDRPAASDASEYYRNNYTCRATKNGLTSFEYAFKDFIDGYVCLIRDGKIIAYKRFKDARRVSTGTTSVVYLAYFDFQDYDINDGEEYSYTHAFTFDEPQLNQYYEIAEDKYTKLQCNFTHSIYNTDIREYKDTNPEDPTGPKLKGQKIDWASHYTGPSYLYYRVTVDGRKSQKFSFKGSEAPKAWYHIPVGMTMSEGTRYMEGDDVDEYHNHTYVLETFVNETDTVPCYRKELNSKGTNQLMKTFEASATEGKFTDRVLVAAKAIPNPEYKEDPGFIVYRRNMNKPVSEFVQVHIQENYGNDLQFYDDQVDPGSKYEYKVVAYIPSAEDAKYANYVTGYAKLTGTIAGNITIGGKAAAAGVTLKLELEEGQSEETMALADSIKSFTATTDRNGNYTFRYVPIMGSGVSYRVVPTNGEHQFEPANTSLVLNETTKVVQTVDFKDTSTFPFYLHVAYEGTNIPVDSVQVEVNGQVMASPNANNTNITGDMSVDDAQDMDNSLCTDKNGYLKVDVPMGRNKIRLVRKGHGVVPTGGDWVVFDTLDIQASVGSEFKPIEFVDTTKVIVAGRVVGGKVQAGKPWTESIANIGEATLKLRLADQRYKLNTMNKVRDVATLQKFVSSEASVQPGSDCIDIKTNAGTGEFYVLVPPVNYVLEEVKQVGGTLCSSATTGQTDFGNVNEVLIETDAQLPIDTIHAIHITPNDSVPLVHGALLVTYRSPKKVEMWDNSPYCGRGTGLFGDATYDYGDKTFDLFIDNEHALGKPVFTTKGFYDFGFKLTESYLRPGADPLDADVVPLIGEKFCVVNGMGSLSVTDDEKQETVGTLNTVLTLDSLGEARYRWNAGFPKLSDDHELTIALRDEETGEYVTSLTGYVLGSIPIPGSEFVTWPREATNEVIHDPYGSGSYAWKESSVSVVNIKTEKKRDIDYDRWYHLEGGIGVYASRQNGTLTGSGIKSWDFHIYAGQDKRDTKTTFDAYSGQVTFEEKEKYTTGSDHGSVGPDADIFVGYAMNTIISDADGLWLKPKGDTEPTSIMDFDFIQERCKTAGLTLDTKFAYTRKFITTVQIPQLEANARALLKNAKYMSLSEFDEQKDKLRDEAKDGPVYYTFYKEDDPKFATNLTDIDASSKERTYGCVMPKTGTYENMVYAYGNGIEMWKSTLRQDEDSLQAIATREKKDNVTLNNYSISRGTSVEKSMSVSLSATNTREYTMDYKAYLSTDNVAHIVAFDANLGGGGLVDQNYDYDQDQDSYTEKTTYGFVLKEDNEGCFLSQDVIAPDTIKRMTNESYTFILRGGQTENPYQRAWTTQYYKDKDGKSVVVGESTQNMAVPVLNIKNGEGVQKDIAFYNLRIGQPVYVTLQLNNLSPQAYKPENYLLGVTTKEQTHGLALTVGGTNIRSKQISYTMYQNQPTDVTLVLTPTALDTLDYENVKVRLFADGWDSWDTYDEVSISLHYTPSAGDVTVKSPSTYVSTKTDEKLNLIVDDYDRMQYGFACIDLMYRKVGEPQFKHTLARFWKDEATSKMPHAGEIPFVGDKAQAHISTIDEQNTIYYAFDMSDPRLYEDGDYEIQAVNRALFVDTLLNKVTICENTSDPWQIHKDTTRPEILGKPLPIGDVLDPNGQIALNFTEDIDPKYLSKDSIRITPDWYNGEIEFDYTLSDRTLVIDVKNDCGPLDDDDLNITVKGLYDMAGNRIAKDPKWTVHIDWLPLKMVSEAFTSVNGAVVQYMEPSPQTVKVRNRSGMQQYFEVSKVPNWMSVYPMDGTVGPYSDFTLTVLANDRMPLGKYTGTIELAVDNDGRRSAHTVKSNYTFTIVDTPPAWTPAKYNAESNMSVVLHVGGKDEGVLFSGEDIVAAFSGKECVGVAKYLDNYGVATATMTICEPANDTLPITFKVWSSRNATIYNNVVADAPVMFEKDAVYGSLAQPLNIYPDDEKLRYVDINRGYNWISLGVDTENQMAADIFAPINYVNTDSIFVKKEKNGYLSAQHGAATGTLEKIEPQTMLSVYSANDPKVLPVIGKQINYDELEYFIPGTQNSKYGATTYWSWITYVPSYAIDVKYALSKFKAVDGDVIKGQRQFAMYYGGQWHGSLEVLYPGQGYKFGSHTAEDRTLTYCTKDYIKYLEPLEIQETENTKQRNRRMMARAKGKEAQQWIPAYGYSDNMCIRAVVMDGEVQITEGQIGGFDVNGICRGAESFDEDGYVYLTIGGDDTKDVILFRYSDGIEEREAINTIQFQNDGMFGLFGEPYIIQLNPEYADIATVDKADGSRIIATFDVSGRRIATGAAPLNSVVINLVEHEDGSVEYVKVINNK